MPANTTLQTLLLVLFVAAWASRKPFRRVEKPAFRQRRGVQTLHATIQFRSTSSVPIDQMFAQCILVGVDEN